MNAKKLPSGSWRCRAYDNKTGKTRSFTAATKKEAEYMANEWLIKRKEKPTDITLDEAVDRYIESKSNTLSPSTIRGYRIIQRNAFGELAELSLGKLDELRLQRWANANAAKYSAKSIHNQFGLLTAVLSQNKVDIDVDAVLLKAKEKAEYNVPPPEIMARIIAAVAGKRVEVPVLIALMCGLRQSEIAALRWEDYDGKCLHVHAAVIPDEDGKLVRKEQPKSYAGNRRVDVPERLKKLLDSADRCKGSISPYRTPSGVLRAFHTICRKNGIPEYKMHELRHAYASLMLLEGVADKYAMERLGQSTPYMIKNVYQHTFKSEQDAISEKLNNAFEKLSGPSENGGKTLAS